MSVLGWMMTIGVAGMFLASVSTVIRLYLKSKDLEKTIDWSKIREWEDEEDPWR